MVATVSAMVSLARCMTGAGRSSYLSAAAYSASCTVSLAMGLPALRFLSEVKSEWRMVSGEWCSRAPDSQLNHSPLTTHHSLLAIRLLRRLCGEGRAAHAHAPARILPQLLRRVQMSERARHGLEVVAGKPFGDVGVIERRGRDRVENLLRQCRYLVLAAALARRVRFACEIGIDSRAIGVGKGDAIAAAPLY